MAYKPGELRERAKELVRARRIGERLTAGIVTVGLFGEEIYRLRSGLTDPMTLLYLGLFILIGVLVFLWQHATDKELGIFFQWLNGSYQPPSTDTQLLMVIGIAIVLVGMLFAARDPLLFGAVFTFYNLVVLFATGYLNRHIKQALADSRVALAHDLPEQATSAPAMAYSDAFAQIDTYFLGRAQCSRHLWIFLVGLAGLGCAVIGAVRHSPSWRDLAYVIFIADILVSEVVIQIWRIRRDERLDAICRQLNELQVHVTSSS